MAATADQQSRNAVRQRRKRIGRVAVTLRKAIVVMEASPCRYPKA
ncbi:hypothetical protein [Ralstonia soli]|nr:hypothetical protein [Ralstonia soli]